MTSASSWSALHGHPMEDDEGVAAVEFIRNRDAHERRSSLVERARASTMPPPASGPGSKGAPASIASLVAWIERADDEGRETAYVGSIARKHEESADEGIELDEPSRPIPRQSEVVRRRDRS